MCFFPSIISVSSARQKVDEDLSVLENQLQQLTGETSGDESVEEPDGRDSDSLQRSPTIPTTGPTVSLEPD